MRAGEWAQRVQHPSGGLTKEYVVTLSSVPNMKELEAIAAGCVVDGVFVQPVSVSFATLDTRRKDKLRVVIGEGRNREVNGISQLPCRCGMRLQQCTMQMLACMHRYVC